jgi:SAM-dependent methyltransferase
MSDAVGWYDQNAREASSRYESISAVETLGWFSDLVPAQPSLVLDVGAGSGRDAAWLARQGHDVVAAEPAPAMRHEGERRHGETGVRWIHDRLPGLEAVHRIGLSFDIILLNAVWMHVAPGDRPRAFRKLMSLLKPGGRLVITLRHGPAEPERGMHEVHPGEIGTLARDHGAFVERQVTSADRMGRPEVSWTQLVVRLPDDGTGALPLLRHIILNDEKASTYKLALLRALCRIANGTAGMARSVDDDHVAVPLGLVGLYWLRLFKPLLEADLPQSPVNRGLDRLGFVKEGFRGLGDLSHLDLRVSARFEAERGAALHDALRDACATIVKMPAHYMTFPGGGPVLGANRKAQRRRPAAVKLDEPYLWSFGELLLPRHIWQALQRFDVWIEPALVSEWSRLIRFYASQQERDIDDGCITRAMRWSDPGRDVGLARERALLLMQTDSLHCVWSGKRLDEKSLDVDHCFPWSAWPCDDLWNLLPAHRQINQHQKRQRLPGNQLFLSARDAIETWWSRAYEARVVPVLARRFTDEACATLPGVTGAEPSSDDVFDAAALQRWRLKHDQQIPEWHTVKL